MAAGLAQTIQPQALRNLERRQGNNEHLHGIAQVVAAGFAQLSVRWHAPMAAARQLRQSTSHNTPSPTSYSDIHTIT